MKTITYGEKYGPAMEITSQTEADTYFEKLVTHNMNFKDRNGTSTNRDEAEQIERNNLGYYAGYYDNETRQRVERLFKCSHPIFGSKKP